MPKDPERRPWCPGEKLRDTQSRVSKISVLTGCRRQWHPVPCSGQASYSQADQVSRTRQSPTHQCVPLRSTCPPAQCPVPAKPPRASALTNMVCSCQGSTWRSNGAETPGPEPASPHTCTVEVILAVGEVLKERDALCLVIVASGCLQQHDLEVTRYRALQPPLC